MIEEYDTYFSDLEKPGIYVFKYVCAQNRKYSLFAFLFMSVGLCIQLPC